PWSWLPELLHFPSRAFESRERSMTNQPRRRHALSAGARERRSLVRSISSCGAGLLTSSSSCLTSSNSAGLAPLLFKVDSSAPDRSSTSTAASSPSRGPKQA
ncbi:unnamed protein product, partial [Ectocarpus sp. 12 AP-2014]